MMVDDAQTSIGTEQCQPQWSCPNRPHLPTEPLWTVETSRQTVPPQSGVGSGQHWRQTKTGRACQHRSDHAAWSAREQNT